MQQTLWPAAGAAGDEPVRWEMYEATQHWARAVAGRGGGRGQLGWREGRARAVQRRQGRGEGGARYGRRERLGRGAYGELWKAERVSEESEDDLFVLKRLFVEKGAFVRLSGLREVHFGRKLRGEDHVARFVEYFDDVENDDLWLVFYYEGVSLQHLLYSVDTTGARVASAFWRQMKQHSVEMRDVMAQLLRGLYTAHARGVTHRDIKPANVLLRPLVGSESISGLGQVSLCDFGSALDEARHDLYGPLDPPSRSHQTAEYSPPEVLFHPDGTVPFDPEIPESYDIWSVGVLFLEMILGSDEVFRVDDRTRAIIENKYANQPKELKELAVLYRAFVEYCIFRPPPGAEDEQAPGRTTDSRTSKSVGRAHKPPCSELDMQQRLKRFDPLGVGAPSVLALRLLRRLLAWNPRDRIPAGEALRHAYFHGAMYDCPVCHAEFELPSERDDHIAALHPHFHIMPMLTYNTSRVRGR